MKHIACLFLTFIFGVGECAKILVVFPMPGPSHYIIGSALAKGLAEAGHYVTMVSPFGEKKPPEHGRYRDVVLTGMSDDESKRSINKFFCATIVCYRFFLSYKKYKTIQDIFNLFTRYCFQISPRLCIAFWI